MKSINRMIQYFKLSFNSLLVLFIFCFVSACSTDRHEQEIYNSLKDNQSKFIFKVEGKDFYRPESIFSGHLEIVEKSFTINFFDQFDSNVMIHFGGDKWYANRPIRVPLKLINNYSSTIMFGRIKDKAKRLGIGYLMSDGFLSITALSKEKIIIKIEGKAKKYPEVDEDDPEYDVQAFLVCKKPNIDFLDVNEKEAFFSKN